MGLGMLWLSSLRGCQGKHLNLCLLFMHLPLLPITSFSFAQPTFVFSSNPELLVLSVFIRTGERWWPHFLSTGQGARTLSCNPSASQSLFDLSFLLLLFLYL